MQKQEITDLLEEKHNKLLHWLQNHPVEKWEQGPQGKWTTGQHILHLIESLKKVNLAMSLPKFILKYKFGTSNRELRNYNEIITRYNEKLAKNQENARRFNANLKVPTLKERQKLLAMLQIQQKKLQHKTKKWSDKDLNNLILPHPLMGKMPIREIVMWSGYHAEHHATNLKENY